MKRETNHNVIHLFPHRRPTKVKKQSAEDVLKEADRVIESIDKLLSENQHPNNKEY